MKKHLLLVDDDIDEFEFITSLSQEMPALKFSYACDGTSALELMSDEMPDVVLLDMNMHAMNGLECLKKIKASARLHSVPVYMYSNCHTPNFIQEARQLGATDCFKKPTTLDVLRKILVVVLNDSDSVNLILQKKSI